MIKEWLVTNESWMTVELKMTVRLIDSVQNIYDRTAQYHLRTHASWCSRSYLLIILTTSDLPMDSATSNGVCPAYSSECMTLSDQYGIQTLDLVNSIYISSSNQKFFHGLAEAHFAGDMQWSVTLLMFSTTRLGSPNTYGFTETNILRCLALKYSWHASAAVLSFLETEVDDEEECPQPVVWRTVVKQQ